MLFKLLYFKPEFLLQPFPEKEQYQVVRDQHQYGKQSSQAFMFKQRQKNND